MMVSKKAWYFTFDALLFAIVVLGSLYFASAPQVNAPYISSTQVISEDLLGVMSAQAVADVEPALLAKYQSNFTNREYTVLEQVGQWWADDEIALVDAFMRDYTGGAVRDFIGLSLHINDEAIFQESSPTPSQLSSGLRIVSGVEKARPVKGSVASARATKVKRNRTLIVSMSPEGAGYGRNGGNNFVNITKTFTLPENITITNATLVVSVHTDRNLNDREFYINDVQVPFQQSDFLYWQEGDVGSRVVTGFLQEGVNTWNAYLSNGNYNGHIHPGTYLYIDYTEETFIDTSFQITDVSRRVYFDQVLSERSGSGRSGAWMSFPFDLPSDATNISSAIFVSATGVRDFTGGGTFPNWNGNQLRRNYDYQIFLNNEAAFDWDNNPSNSQTYFYDSATITPLLVNGTNLVSVFFNNYMDSFWGNQDVTILNESYIELNYTIPISTVGFGLIEVSASEEIGGSANSDRTVSFNFPDAAVAKKDAKLFIVQQYSNKVTVWADPFANPTTQVFRSPSPRGVPSEVVIPKEQLELQSTVTNYIRVRDDGSGNYILPISRILYEFSVPASVGFGDVFSTDAEAEADAIARLQAAMGAYVDATNIETTSNTITDVPTLWGPAEIEVRSWQ